MHFYSCHEAQGFRPQAIRELERVLSESCGWERITIQKYPNGNIECKRQCHSLPQIIWGYVRSFFSSLPAGLIEVQENRNTIDFLCQSLGYKRIRLVAHKQNINIDQKYISGESITADNINTLLYGAKVVHDFAYGFKLNQGFIEKTINETAKKEWQNSQRAPLTFTEGKNPFKINLGPDIKAKMMAQLSLSDLISFASTCKHNYTIFSNNKGLWIQLLKRDFPTCPKLNELNAKEHEKERRKTYKRLTIQNSNVKNGIYFAIPLKNNYDNETPMVCMGYLKDKIITLNSIGYGQFLEFWDVKSGERLTLHGDSNLILHVTDYFVLTDQFIVHFSWDSPVVRDMVTNKFLFSIPNGPYKKARGEKDRVALVTDNQVLIWSLRTNQALFTFNTANGKAEHCCLAKGKFTVLYEDDTVQTWDIYTGNACSTITHPQINVIQSDGSRIVTGTSLGEIMVWDVNTGQNIQTFEGESNIKQLELRESTVFALESNRGISVWGMDSGLRISFVTDHTAPARPIEIFAILGDYLITDSSVSIGANIWEIKSGKYLTYLPYTTPIAQHWKKTPMIISTGSRVVISASGRRAPIIYDFDAVKELVLYQIANRLEFGYRNEDQEIAYAQLQRFPEKITKEIYEHCKEQPGAKQYLSTAIRSYLVGSMQVVTEKP